MTQAKINMEADAGRLLRAMLPTGFVACTHPGVSVVRWLLRSGYAKWYGGKLYITEPRTDQDGNRVPGPMTGREYYEGLCANPFVTENPRVWIDRVRSGLEVVTSKRSGFTVTRESKIENAVIPKPEPPHTTRTPEDMMSDMEGDLAAQAKWCEKLGVSLDELQELGAADSIKVCPTCDEVGIIEHPGKGWRKKCRKCLGK